MSKTLVLFLLCVTKVSTDKCYPCECDVSTTYNKRITCAEYTVELHKLINEIPLVNFTKFVAWNELTIKNQNITVLKKNAFANVGLIHLINIVIVNSGIRIVHPETFFNVSNLAYLDLSYNSIVKFHDETFKPIKYMKYLYLTHNKIVSINSKLFSELKFLQHLELNDNFIISISENALANNLKLHTIYLNNNMLTYLNVTAISKFDRLANMRITDNPWTCDCYIRGLFEMIKKTVYAKQQTSETKCKAPNNLKQPWTYISQEMLNCWLNVKTQENVLESRVGEDIRITCHVDGSPLPLGFWTFKDKVIDLSNKKYNVTRKDINQIQYWFNLDIFDLDYEDEGTYKCVFDYLSSEEKSDKIILKLKGKPIDTYYISVVTGIVISFVCILVILMKVAIKCSIIRNATDDQSNHQGNVSFDDDISFTEFKMNQSKNNGLDNLSRFKTSKSSNRM